MARLAHTDYEQLPSGTAPDVIMNKIVVVVIFPLLEIYSFRFHFNYLYRKVTWAYGIVRRTIQWQK
jgi:hypothetical protein